MKLSNTMIMTSAVLPSNKKAFTLAEVLITLSILGVVAALTIPSLVNRQSEMAAIVKMKKAISQFEQVAEVYMAENEAENIVGMVQTKADGTTDTATCGGLAQYFKQVNGAGTCTFTTADRVQWNFKPDGTTVTVYDSETSPKLGVVMNAADGKVNATAGVKADIQGEPGTDTKVFTVNDMLSINKPADIASKTNLNE